MIKNTITNAADITVFKLIDNNYKVGGGPLSIAGTVVIATRGAVGRVISVTNDTWKDVLGKPLPRSYGEGFEGLRHLAEAAEDCSSVKVVRVVAADARFPVITVNADGSVTKTEHPFGTTVVAGAGALFSVYPKDGDKSTDRKVEVTAIDAAKGRFTVVLYGKNTANEDVVLEKRTVSFIEDAVDDMGVPAFIESVFEEQSSRLSVVVAEGASIDQLQAIEATAFEGGFDGSKPTTEDWVKAWDLFRDDRVQVNQLFAAGNYDETVLGNMVEIATGRYLQFFFDAPPYLKHDAAIKWAKESGLEGRQCVLVHGSYSALDPYYGGSSVWGFSGSAVASRARANATYSGAVPGVYYTVAGTKRGTVNRRNVKPLYPDDILDKDALYAARINPILANDSGVGIYIGDSLALHFEENYKRFEWINSLDNYITHLFVQGAAAAKFEPDGLAEDILQDLMEGIFEPLVTAGGVVTPRNPEVDGEAPYRVRIYQQEIDLWMVEYDYCPVGSARRIAGQPMLIQ